MTSSYTLHKIKSEQRRLESFVGDAKLLGQKSINAFQVDDVVIRKLYAPDNSRLIILFYLLAEIFVDTS